MGVNLTVHDLTKQFGERADIDVAERQYRFVDVLSCACDVVVIRQDCGLAQAGDGAEAKRTLG